MNLTGLIAATHTPFDAHGELNLDAIPQQVAWLLEQKVKLAFIAGSTGESHSLSLDERLQLARRWCDVTAGTELKFIVHVGSNCLRDAAVLAEQAEQLGALAIAALAPSYFKPASLETLVASMQQIASRAPGLPFYYYDIPALTQIRLSVPQFLEAANEKIPNLAGVKFTNEDYTSLQLCLAASDRRWDILWGVDEALLAALAMGVQGGVGSSYNFAARIYQRMIAAFEAGDLETARGEQLKSIRTIQAIAKYSYLPAAKHVMELLGVPVGGARLPLETLCAENKRNLQNDLERLGFFDWIAA